MKPTICFIAFFAMISSSIFAKKMPAYYVTHQGDTVRTTIEIGWNGIRQEPKRNTVMADFVAFDSLGKKTRFTPAEVKTFVVSYPNGNSDTFAAILWKEKNDDYQTFALVNDIAGELKLYQYFEQSHDYQDAPAWLLQKGDRVEIIHNYPKQVLSLIEDNPTLSEEVRQRKYKHRDMPQIVKEYNKGKGQ